MILPGWFVDAAMKGEGRVMRRLRKHRGLSQAEVASRVGICQGYGGDGGRGGAVPTLDVLGRISAALDLDPTWMRCLERNRVAGA